MRWRDSGTLSSKEINVGDEDVTDASTEEDGQCFPGPPVAMETERRACVSRKWLPESNRRPGDPDL